MDKLKEAHDKILAEMSAEEVTAHEATCLFCNPELTEEDSNERGEMKSFTEQEKDEAVKTAVAEALAPLQDELDKLKADKADGEVDARITEAKAEADKLVADANLEKDQAVAEATAAAKKHDDLVAYLEKLQADAEAAELAETRKTERLDALKAVADFPEDYVADNLERWVAMDDEQFGSMVETLKLVSVKEEAGEEKPASKIPDTAMLGTRSEKGSKAVGIIGRIHEASKQGVSIRTLK